ncbi:hypothetical protein Cgig2_000221 [Carnegiea gigantea]|uniref:Uncharacterized protein n=1 Tax=Carnegiea gigantea TaxID=171969 RepID=A0A9Q1JQN5_9CARY|nr:hypothetical protein Cgig2_000221 [Carnegiea gigantea]
MSSSSFGNQSPASSPTLPKVTIMDPILILNCHELPPTCAPLQVHDKGTSSICTSHVPLTDNLILAHPDQTINQEVPANMAPLNAMDEDLLAEPNENDYEDSQDIPVDKDEMADTFLNLNHIQDLDMSFESFKRHKVEEGDEGEIWVLWNNNNCHTSVLAKENHAIHMLVHNPGNSKNILLSGVYGPTQALEKRLCLGSTSPIE